MPDDMEIAIYRIVQEALSNIIRHADADSAKVRLIYEKELIVLKIKDDGIGFVVPESPSDLIPEGHFGLLGIFERVELMGATLKISSTLGHGTELILAFPYQTK